jgi:uncharacterized protein YbaP (TraB family)
MNIKNYLLLLAAIACLQIAKAQKLSSTLLWKISGNGLQKPSYLYGTMHLTDERVFNLGDSVYKAIENCDGFATEIDPAEFTPLVIDEAKKYYAESVRLKDVLHKDEFKKYGKVLAKKLNKNEDDITTADILREKNKWIQESYSTGKMQTFLDVYLFDIARRQGKWTGGVEDLKDQENVLDLIDETDLEELVATDDESKNTIDEATEYLINAYVKNDLNAIEKLAYSGDSLHEDALLVKRNKKMAMRMDSLSHERTMVFAVGAAHLPGDKGLIHLLTEKGFTVTPVISSQKIKPQNYKVAEVPLKWYDVKDESGLYKADMPGEAGDMTLYGMLTMKIYFDAFASTVYMTTALKTPYSQKMIDSVFGHLSEYYFGVSDYTKGKPILINNVPGREFASTKNNYSRGYLLFKDGTMYMAIAVSMKKDTAAASSVDRFLHSFSITENKDANAGNFMAVENKIKAYHIDVPGKPVSVNDIAGAKDSSILRELSAVVDQSTGTYFFWGANEAAPGYFVENDSTTLAGIRESQKVKFASMSIDTIYIKDGVRMMDIGGIMTQAPLMLKAHYQFRGNRWYALVAMYDAAKNNPSVDEFFNSFSPIAYANTEWGSFTTESKLFSAWSPGNFTYTVKPTVNSGDSIAEYETYDSSRADSYTVVERTFGKYYWRQNDSAFWKKLLHDFDDDSVLIKRTVKNGELSGYEYETEKNGSGNVKRERMLLNGNKLYSIVTIQAASEINNENTNKFFDALRFNTIKPNDKIFVSKASILLTDIVSADSVTRNEAFNYLSKSPFSKTELPLLHAALLKNYPEDDNDYKNKLADAILDLKDSSSYTFAKDNYADADDDTKNILLNIMASFKTKENFDDIKTLLLKQPPHKELSYDVVYNLTDSIQLAAEIVPDLLVLLKDSAIAPNIITITNKVIDSGLINKNLLQPYYADILKLSVKRYNELKADADAYSSEDYTLEDILRKMNTNASNKSLQQWSVVSQIYLEMNAVEGLLANQQPISAQALLALAKDNNTRIELYGSLKAYKKENLFPVHYFTQKYFAESYAYSAGSDDDDPSDITFLTQKIINFKGRQSRFYFYKITYSESDDASYTLACAGPFRLALTDISSKDATGDIYYDEDFNATNLAAQMDALIKQMEDGFVWADEKDKK